VTDRDRLVELLARRSLRRGDFVLASGKRSSYYIDARLTTMSGAGQQLIGELGLAALGDAGWKPRAIGGLTLGADPVAYAIAHAAARHGLELDAFTVRKEPKTHGTGKRIEGVFEAGWPVVIVEDVMTTGESAVRALQAVRAAGGAILGVLAIVDREEGGAERLQSEGVVVRSLARVSELL
jgi:orotate phosphoribosyltransferase